MKFSSHERALDAKEDKDYSTRRSITKHEMKKAIGNAPGFWKKSPAKEHLKLSMLTENDPRNWSKYKK